MKRRQALVALLLFLSSCSAAQLGSRLGTDGPSRLRFSVSDLVGPLALESEFAGFRDVLSAALDLPVELFPLESSLSAAPAILADRLDLVLASPSEYLILQARAHAVPILAVTRPNYYTTIAVRADSELGPVIK